MRIITPARSSISPKNSRAHLVARTAQDGVRERTLATPIRTVGARISVENTNKFVGMSLAPAGREVTCGIRPAIRLARDLEEPGDDGGRARWRWPWASARRRRSSGCSTRCCCGRCRIREADRLVELWGNVQREQRSSAAARRFPIISTGAISRARSTAWRPWCPTASSLRRRRAGAGQRRDRRRAVLRIARRCGRSRAACCRTPIIARMPQPVAVIGERLWEERFNRSPDALGRDDSARLARLHHRRRRSQRVSAAERSGGCLDARARDVSARTRWRSAAIDGSRRSRA